MRNCNTLLVPKLDWLALSITDTREIADQLAARGTRLQLDASVDDPTDPMAKLLFKILATFAEFAADLIRLRTREGMAAVRAEGKRPKLSGWQSLELRRMHNTGDYSIIDLVKLFSVCRPTKTEHSSAPALVRETNLTCTTTRMALCRRRGCGNGIRCCASP